jgi:hypothetical protein
MKNILATLLIVGACCMFAVAQTATVNASDLANLEGPRWSGTLTYLDYRSNKKTSIKSAVIISKQDANTWAFAYEYPDEPKANGSSNVTLAEGGRIFADGTVIEKTLMPNGDVKIVTTKPGTDNKLKATFRYTYLISAKSFSIKKEVQTEGSTEWFERNGYDWTR